MGLFSNLFNTNLIADEPLDKQRADLLSNPMVIMGHWETQEGCDEIPGSKGAFGMTKSNPIPVNGITGEVCYINRLRSKTGVGFFYHRLGSLENQITRKPVDQFELVAADASEWLIIYLSPYYLRRSRKAPTGLILMSWDGMSKFERIICKFNAFGCTSYVDNFPVGLIDIISNDRKLNSLGPGSGNAMAKKISEILHIYEGKWRRPYHLPPL